MEGNSIEIFQKLCKDFEMKIKLDKFKGEEISEEILEEYENYAVKIDNFYNESFQKELKNLISPKDTLEKEQERLKKLIDLLEGRLKKRSELAGNFHETTGKYIKNLQLIVSESELNSKKDRLELITRYLDTTKEIDDVTSEIKKFNDDLMLEETKKEEYDSRNKVMEDELYSVFVTTVNGEEYYRDIEEEKILDILAEVSSKAEESRETLDITEESVEKLLSNGANDEYNSYIEEAKKSYALWREREIILNIYKLVIDFKEDFADLVSKRTDVVKFMDELKRISNTDILDAFEKVVVRQNRTLDDESNVLKSIDNYTSRIAFKEERLENLKEIINDPEILAILDEYHVDGEAKEEDFAPVIDTDSKNVEEEKTSDEIEVKEHNPYGIVSVTDYPSTLNIGLAKLKGASVRDKVNKKLNPDVVSTSDSNKEEAEELVFKTDTVVDPKLETPVFPETTSDVEKKENEIQFNPIGSLDVPNFMNNGETNNNVVAPIDVSSSVNSADTSSNATGNAFWVPISEPNNQVVNPTINPMNNNSFPEMETNNNIVNNPTFNAEGNVEGASNFSFPTIEGGN